MAVPRVAQWAPVGGNRLGRGALYVKSKVLFHLHVVLLENAWSDFNQTWQESSLGTGDSKLFIVHMAPIGARERAPQGPKPCKFQTSSPDPEVEQSRYM